MRTLILCGTNEDNPELTELHNLLLSNKQQYAARHGYDFESISGSYGREGFMKWFKSLDSYFDKYDRIMTVGADVIYMNMRISLDSFKPFPLTISREKIQWWPINNDVCIWNNHNGIARNIAHRIASDIDIWIKYPWLWQIHLWNLIQDEPEIAAMVNIVETNLLGSTPFKGESEWRLGQFLVHLLALPIKEKIRLARELYLPLAGEPTWKPCNEK
jgi:hypothetical protein